MKKKILALLFIGLTLAIAAGASQGQSAQAQTNKYFCAQLGGVWRTFGRNPRGNVPMISWISDGNPEWPPRRRCIEVSNRFERFFDNGMRSLATGIINNESVICLVRSPGDPCHSSNVLVTLPPNMDRHQAAQKLMDLRGLAAGRTLDLSGNQLARTIEGEIYYDLEQWLQVVAVETAPLTPEWE